MKLDRVKEIIAAPELIRVTYREIPVWLWQIKDNGRVEVDNLNSSSRLEVPVTDLMEAGDLEDNDLTDSGLNNDWAR